MDKSITEFINCKWNKKKYIEFQKYLLTLTDNKYKNFQSRLIPNNAYEMIGIRIPQLRWIANKIYNDKFHAFLEYTSYKYYEEVIINSIIISKIENRDIQLEYIKKLIPYLNNWGLCDTFVSSMKCVKKDLDFYFNYFKILNNRVMIVIFLNYYLNDKYIDEVFKIIENINSDDYYINMSISWLLAEAYVNYKEKVEMFLSKCKKVEIVKITRSKIRESKKIK